jgi:DNA-binding transcriptional regulator YiaG
MATIKQKRLELGLTQQQLADLTGVPFRTIQNWETGQRKCPDYVERLLLFFLEHSIVTEKAPSN